MNKAKIALQLMTLREVCSFGAKGLLNIKDIEGKKIYGINEAFRKIKELGINNVELSKVMVTDETAEEMVKACREYDMKIVGMSVIYERFMPDEPGDTLEYDMEKIIKRCKQLGCKYVRTGMMPRSCINSEKGFYQAAKGYDKFGEELRKAGIKLYYHTHHFEFQKFGDKYGIEILMENSKPENLGFELDTHWTQRGGQNIEKWIQKLAGRIDLLHLKDYRIQLPQQDTVDRKTLQGCIEFAEIGEGTLDWKSIIPEGDKAGAVWLPIEQDDTYGRDPFESIRISVNNLKKMGFSDRF